MTIAGKVFAPKAVLALRHGVGDPETLVMLTLKPTDQRRILNADFPPGQIMYDPALRDAQGNFQFLAISLKGEQLPWLTGQLGPVHFELQASPEELDRGLIGQCDEPDASDSNIEENSAAISSVRCSLKTKTPFATKGGDASVDLRLETKVHSKMPAECADCED